MVIEEIKKDLITALKAKDSQKVMALRYLSSEIKNKEIELRQSGEEVTDEVAVSVIKKQIKKRTKSKQAFEEAGRSDLAEKEAYELDLMQEYYDRFSKEG